jgi:hypothetical protein
LPYDERPLASLGRRLLRGKEPGKVTTSSTWHEERQFGRTVGVVLLLLGAWFTYRGRYPAAVPVLFAVGSVLAVLAFVWPRALVWPNKGWMALAEVLAFVSTRVILGALFVVVITPLGALMRLTRWDPLQRRAGRQETYWLPYSPRQHDPKHFERMF